MSRPGLGREHLPLRAGVLRVCAYATVEPEAGGISWRKRFWIHKLADAEKAEADGMDYICEHLFQV